MEQQQVQYGSGFGNKTKTQYVTCAKTKSISRPDSYTSPMVNHLQRICAHVCFLSKHNAWK